MAADLSSKTRERKSAYDGVVAQQGRVILDRDFNAIQETISGSLSADALDIIGPCGTPDDGFNITFPQLSPPSPPFWSPPSPLEFSEASAFDFLISPGTMYVGGRRVHFPGRQLGEAITYSYFDQPDWPNPDAPARTRRGTSSLELVYLNLLEHEVSAVEDPDLLEPALGGPDTTGRLRLVRRVKRAATDATSCLDAWTQQVSQWQSEGFVFDSTTMQLLPDATLQVGFTQDPSTGDPCDPVATGGYLGQDNQLIRVALVTEGGNSQLLWGFDNASFMYRVAANAYNGRAVQLTQDPPDQFHNPQTNQVIEVLRTAVVLGSELEESASAPPVQIERCVATERGAVRALSQPYGPVNTGDPNYLYFSDGLPAEYLNDTNSLFVRVWQALQDFTPGTPCELIDPVSGGSTGLTVTITSQTGNALPDGAFWSIAVRPGTPQAVYPEELLVAPQIPDGPHRWACPLAVIDWEAGNITDCRQQFDNLVTLSKRRGGCCTINVSPDDLSGNSLQNIIDRAALSALGRATVCLGSGVYVLDAPLRLGRMHANLTLEGCGPRVVLYASPQNAQQFSDGLVVLTETTNATLRGLLFVPAAARLPQLATMSLFDLLSGFESPDVVKQVVSQMKSAICIRAVNAPNLTIEACKFDYARQIEFEAPCLFGAGIFFQGDCSGAVVEDCNFEAAFDPTFHQFPSVTSVSPSGGPATGETSVTIQGFGLLGASVTFGGVAAQKVNAYSDTSIDATSPAGNGIVDVIVTTPNGISQSVYADQFTYLEPGEVAVTAVYQNYGSSPLTVGINGQGFQSGIVAANFGANNPSPNVTVNSDTEVTAQVPPQPPGTPSTVDITVTTPVATSPINAGDRFTYPVAGLFREAEVTAPSTPGNTTAPATARFAEIERTFASPPGGERTTLRAEEITYRTQDRLRAVLSDLGRFLISHQANAAGEFGITATIGCLAEFYLGDLNNPSSTPSLTSELGNITLRNNTCSGFTFGFYGLTDVTNFSFAGNTIDRCVSGCWLELLGANVANDPLWPIMLGFAERLVVDAISLEYTLPPESVNGGGILRGGIVNVRDAVRPPVHSSSYVLTNNKIQTISGGSGAGGAASAVVMIVGQEQSIDGISPIVMSSNTIQNDSEFPTVAIGVAPSDKGTLFANASITGNIISHLQLTNKVRAIGIIPLAETWNIAPSLWFLWPGPIQYAGEVAIAGNMCVGKSNILEAHRLDGVTLTWAPYNYYQPRS